MGHDILRKLATKWAEHPTNIHKSFDAGKAVGASKCGNWPRSAFCLRPGVCEKDFRPLSNGMFLKLSGSAKCEAHLPGTINQIRSME